MALLVKRGGVDKREMVVLMAVKIKILRLGFNRRRKVTDERQWSVRGERVRREGLVG